MNMLLIFRRIAAVLALTMLANLPVRAQQEQTNPVRPEWCRELPRLAYKNLERIASPDPWFQVYKIAPGVFAIYEPHQWEEVISYLILGEKKAILFDTGMGISDIQKIAVALTSLPVAVVNSHTHNDHVGGNWEFSEIYGMDTAFTRANAQGSREDAQPELVPGAMCGGLSAGFDPKTYATRPFRITHWLHDGDILDLGGRKLQVISTPGHTPDAICLLDRQNGLLWTGDTFYPGPIFLYRPETDLDAYVLSVEKLTALAPQMRQLLPAHNVPVAEPAYLPKVVAAMKQVRAGQIQPITRDGKREYHFDGFSFLMAPVK